MEQHISKHFTLKILIGMFAGILLGVALKHIPLSPHWHTLIVDNGLTIGGQLFLNLIKMLVVPLVFASLVCGSASMGDFKKMGRIGAKTLGFYLITTALAIAFALLVATLLHVGEGVTPVSGGGATLGQVPTLREIIINMVPMNPVAALAQGNMLQIIVFAILLGMAAMVAGEPGRKVINGFAAFNSVMMRLITMVLALAPYGVFCLLAVQFSRLELTAIFHLVNYFFTVLTVLVIQLVVVYSLMLIVLQRLNPFVFLRKLYGTLVFAFSTSSSVASIPVVLKAVEKKLGVNNEVASFVIPLGATINMDGTAIMQGVATVFIAHLYHIPLGLTGYLIVIAMATLASIGTAGVPGVGLITLIMVLQQVGLPVEGIAMIIGVDRLLDMVRTAVNVSGDAMISCLVASSEGTLDRAVYNQFDDDGP